MSKVTAATFGLKSLFATFNSPSMASSESLDHPHHPLLNPLIRTLVFDYLPPSSWNSVRLVNKTWYFHLLRQWRETTFVILGTTSFPGSAHQVTVTDHLHMSHPFNNPSDPYHFHLEPFRNCRTSKVPLLSSQLPFWSVSGRWLVRWHLHQVHIPQVDFFKHVLFKLTPNLEEFSYSECTLNNEEVEPQQGEYIPPKRLQKNLTSIKIVADTFCEGDSSPFPISWMNLFSTFQNVQKLEVSFYPPETSSSVLAIVKAIGIIRRENPNALNITHFIFPGNTPSGGSILTGSTISRLNHLSLPISVLNVNLGLSVGERELTSLIEAHQDTLREVTFERLLASSTVYQTFPYQILPKNLTKIVCLRPLFPNLGFLAFTPNLTALEVVNICDCSQIADDLESRKITPLKHLKKLNYSVGRGQGLDMRLGKIMTLIMPNINQLKIGVDSGGFESVSEGWRELKRLEVTLHQIPEDCFVQHFPKLKGIKCVRILGQSMLNDVAIYQVFLKMPELYEISVQFSSKVSPEAVQVLKERIKETSGVNVDK